MRKPAYREYLLLVLLVVLTLNYMDRLAFGMVLQAIKGDLKLSDTQLGFLSGIAWSLFYSVMGIPIARWVDRGNRVTVIATTTALWTATVSLCGFAGSFAQLMLLRAGTAIGEAGSMPSAHSLVADYFSRADRPKAVSVFMLSSALSAVGGYLIAGWLNEIFGWRTTFVLLGIPGLAVALLAWLTLREPRLAIAGQLGRPACSDTPTVAVVLSTLWRNRTYRHLLIGYSVVAFFGQGIQQWKAPFFIRSYGLNTGALGTWFALIYGVIGFPGTYLGGRLASRYARKDEGLQLKAVAALYCAFGIISVGIYISPNPYLAFALLALSVFGISLVIGPFFATIQTLVPNRMRAMSISILYFFANLIGLGIGPLAAGALSDALRPIAGDESLRYSLLALCPGYLWCSWHFLQASRTAASDVALVQRQDLEWPTVRNNTPGGDDMTAGSSSAGQVSHDR